MEPEDEADLLARAERQQMHLVEWPDGTVSVYEPSGPKPFFPTRLEALAYLANRTNYGDIFRR